MAASESSRRERFEALFPAHYREVHRDALRRVEPVIAEEIANETFLICWRRLEGVPEPANGHVFGTLSNGKVDAVRGEWRNGEGERGFAENLETVVEQFRARFPKLRDAGDATFNGRPARAYTDGDTTTYYVDRETSLPLGSTMIGSYTVVPAGDSVQLRFVTTIDRFQKLPVTPENLALLDAPRIDSAER